MLAALRHLLLTLTFWYKKGPLESIGIGFVYRELIRFFVFNSQTNLDGLISLQTTDSVVTNTGRQGRDLGMRRERRRRACCLICRTECLREPFCIDRVLSDD